MILFGGKAIAVAILGAIALALMGGEAHLGDFAVTEYRGYLIGTNVKPPCRGCAPIANWSIWDLSAGRDAVRAWHAKGGGDSPPGILVSGQVEGVAADALVFVKQHIDEQIAAHGRVPGVHG